MNFGDPDLIEAVDAHIARHVAPVEMVFHEIISTDMHIDVHWVPPAPGRPFHTLVTSGMSERPMPAPAEAAEWRYAELAMLLDPAWSLDQARFDDEDVYWPIRLLKVIARFPFDVGTWVGPGHTIAASNPPEPFAPGTELSSAVLLPPLSLPEGFMRMPRPDGSATYFWTVLPLYAEELALKLEKGSDALLDALDAAGVNDIVRASRPRGGRRKKFLGLF